RARETHGRPHARASPSTSDGSRQISPSNRANTSGRSPRSVGAEGRGGERQNSPPPIPSRPLLKPGSTPPVGALSRPSILPAPASSPPEGALSNPWLLASNRSANESTLFTPPNRSAKESTWLLLSGSVPRSPPNRL